MLLEDAAAREHRRRQAARHMADERDAVGAQVEQPRGEEPSDHEHERARHPGGHEAQAEDDRQRRRTHEEGRSAHVSERA